MMTYDDYDMMYERLMYLKKNQNKLSLNERTKKVIEEIGKHPDAFEMYKGVFLTPDQVKNLQRFGINGKQASQYILNQCELRTKNSLELTYRYYGYVKPITPAILNQVIDDVAGNTLVSASTLQEDVKKGLSKTNNVEAAAKLGEVIAKKATDKGITEVVFDRGGYIYQGKVKALAEAAREAGLKF